MANARLLRQYLDDYNKKLKGANADYKEAYTAYAKPLEEHNAFLTQVKTQPGVAFVGDVGHDAVASNPWLNATRPDPTGPMYGAVVSYTDKNGAIAYKGIDAGKTGKLNYGSSNIFKSQEEASKFYQDNGIPFEPGGIAGEWIQNPGTNTVSWYSPQVIDTYWVNKDGQRVANDWQKVEQPDMSGGDGGGGGTVSYWYNPKTGQTNFDAENPGVAAGLTEKIDSTWVQTKPGAYRTSEYLGNTTAPTQEEVKAPSFTLNQIEQMQNPTENQAGMAMSQAKGYTGNSALVAEQDGNSRNSAFNNLSGDDPRGLKDKGVLTRAIAGEL